MPHPRSPAIRTYLVLLALVCFLPPLGLVVISEVRGYHRQTERAGAQLLETAWALTLAVDGRIEGQVRALQALALSRDLRDGDLERFRAEALEFLANQPPGSNIILSDAGGQQLLNTLVPPGRPLPQRGTMDATRHVFGTGTAFVSNLYTGAVTRAAALSVDVPVLVGGKVAYDLTLGLTPASFEELLRRQRVPEGSVVTILDRGEASVARVPSGEQFVGKPASPSLRTLMRAGAEGIGTTRTLEGREVVTAFSRSSVSGWSVAVGLPKEALLGPLRRNVSAALAVGCALLGGCALLALFLARRVSVPIRALPRYAGAVAAGEAVLPPAGVAEVEAVARELAATAAALRDSGRQLRLVADSQPTLISFIDATLRYRFVNRAYEDWFGDPAEHVLGRAVPEVLGEAAFERVRPHMEAALAGERVAFEAWIPYRGGNTRYVHATYIPHRTEEGRVAGFFVAVADLSERRRSEERQALLAKEVDHRAKNMLTVVQSVLRLTRADNYRDFLRTAEGRLAALARAHDLLAANRWDGARLDLLVRDELAPYAATGRVRLSGPTVELSPDAAQSLAMVVHELATNAVKYGALSVAGGRLDVAWALEPDGALSLAWTERGGPPVSPPARTGFGSMVLEASLTRQLGGTARMDWRAEGLRVAMTVGPGFATAAREEPVVA